MDQSIFFSSRGTPEGIAEGVHVLHIGNPVVEAETQSPSGEEPVSTGDDEYTNRYDGAEEEQSRAAGVTREPIDDRHPLAVLTSAQRETGGNGAEHGQEQESGA